MGKKKQLKKTNEVEKLEKNAPRKHRTNPPRTKTTQSPQNQGTQIQKIPTKSTNLKLGTYPIP